MGQGGIGGNGSVKWEFVHHDEAGDPVPIKTGVPGKDNQVGIVGGHAVCKDPISFADIGKTRPGTQDMAIGYFKVTLCYKDSVEANAARTNSWVVGSCVVLHVPVVDRTVSGNESRPTEILVEW